MALLDEILLWSQKSLRPWQQDAVRRLFQQTLDGAGLDDLYSMLKAGAGQPDPQERKPEPFSKEHLPVSTVKADAVTLLSMEKLANVNRLASDQVLRFSPKGLTVIYGGNGSGKSGYARVLKRACRSRDASEDVRPNALLKPAEQGVPQCSFTIEMDGTNHSVDWLRGKAPPSELATIAVFDTHCARAFLDQDQEIAYLPFGLDVVEDLAQVVLPRLGEKLAAELATISTNADGFKHLLGATKVGAMISTLEHKTSDADVEQLATMSDEEIAKAAALEKTLGETDLASKIKSLRLAVGRMNDLRKRIDGSASWVKDEAVEKLKGMDIETEAAMKAASEAATLLRSGDVLLPGTGDLAWKSLYEAAREFSLLAAYAQQPFPHVHDDAQCVLCQQPLSTEGADRLMRFEAFVQENVAKTASEKLNARAAAIEKIRSANIAIRLDDAVAEELEHYSPGLVAEIVAFDASIEARRAWLLETQKAHIWEYAPELPLDPRIRLTSLADDLSGQANQYEKASNGEERSKLERECAEFKARLALTPLKNSLLDLLARMRTKAILTKCKDELQTKGISEKAKELASQAVTTPLRVALKEEFAKLDVSLAAPRLDERVKKGKLSHKLELELQTAAAIRDILSEGEQRAIAIASFLAELRVGGHGGGIVFDDPVSSLDHFRRIQVARRLVDEAAHRQVIVFTHDTVFLAELCELVTSLKVEHVIHNLEWDGAFAGKINDGLPWHHQTFNDRIDKLWKAQNALPKPWPQYPNEAESGVIRSHYNKLRAAIERAIQDVVFAGVVVRYRDWIKVGHLSDVVGFTDLECAEFSRLHQRCCEMVDAHDPASGKNAPVPTASALGDDINALALVVDSIKKRQAAAKKLTKAATVIMSG